MSKIEIKLKNIDEQKKILNNGKLNMIDVVQHLKINNIVNYDEVKGGFPPTSGNLKIPY